MLDQRTDTLPYGKQRLLEIAARLRLRAARAAARRAGGRRARGRARDILDAIAALPADVAVLLIEHDMDLVFSFAERISVLVNGAPAGRRRARRRSPPIRACAPSISARAAMAELLASKACRAGYGGAVVLSDVAFRLGEGEALACWAATASARPR